MTDQNFAGTPPCQDYSAEHFSGVTVSLHQLFYVNFQTTKQPLIVGKTFTDCLIQGPAVLLVTNDVLFDSCNMGAMGDDPRNLILLPMSTQGVVGPIAVQNSRFTRCDFMGVGYTGPDTFIDNLLQVLEANSGRPQPNA